LCGEEVAKVLPLTQNGNASTKTLCDLVWEGFLFRSVGEWWCIEIMLNHDQ